MNMYKDLKDALEEPLGHLKYDVALYKQIKNFRITWMQKSPEYLDFLGGKNLGVYPIRFSTRDEELLFVDILQLDMNNIKSRVYDTKGINISWKISSNPYYNVIIYMMHKYYTSKDINDKLKEEVVKELFIIYYYKVIGSLLSRYFPYNTSEDIAKATVERLSKKSLIIKLSNWQEVIEYRAGDVAKKGLHYKKLIKYDTDNAVEMLNDTQGRVRDMFKNIYRVLMEVVEDGERIKKTSLLKDDEDGVKVSDVTNRPDKHIIYAKSIINNSTEFIDRDLIDLVLKLNNNNETRMMNKSLAYMSEELNLTKKPDIVEYCIINSIGYLTFKNFNVDYVNNIVEVIKALKGYWNNGVKDKEYNDIKNIMVKIVKKGSGKITPWRVEATVTAIMVYIFIRTIVGKR